MSVLATLGAAALGAVLGIVIGLAVIFVGGALIGLFLGFVQGCRERDVGDDEDGDEALHGRRSSLRRSR